MAEDRRCWCGMPAATTHVHAGADPAASGTFPAADAAIHSASGVRPMPDPYEEAKRLSATEKLDRMRVLMQAANITLKWHGEHCSTDMCECGDDARVLLQMAQEV